MNPIASNMVSQGTPAWGAGKGCLMVGAATGGSATFGLAHLAQPSVARVLVRHGEEGTGRYEALVIPERFIAAHDDDLKRELGAIPPAVVGSEVNGAEPLHQPGALPCPAATRTR
jgi:hypothetical protein